MHRGDLAYVVLNLYPYAPGHLMVCPYRHIADYTETTDEEAAEIADLTRDAMRLVRAVSGAQGFNIGMNQGDVAGAGISAHLHQHVVPRWPGDQNFMPIIGRTKTLPELLGETRTLLAGAWPAPHAMSGLADDAALAGELVREAGRLARRMRAAGLDSRAEDLGLRPGHRRRHAAERLIVERLRAERPDDAIVGEEGTDHPGTSGRAWVIDPVDGTYNFVAGLPWWCSALALTDGDDAGARRGPPPRDGHALRGRPGPALDPRRRAAAAARGPAAAARCARRRTCTTRGRRRGAWRRSAGWPAAPRPCGCWARAPWTRWPSRAGQLGVSFQHSVPDWDRLPGAAIIRGAGGVARQVEAAGVTWSVAGARTAVDDVCRALGEG